MDVGNGVSRPRGSRAAVAIEGSPGENESRMNAAGHDSSDQELPVLFAGGGLVGLSTAMFLAQHGIASLAVERLRSGSQLPRAAFFHMRTLEMFRSCGIEEAVRAQSAREFEPEGALIIMDTLAGKVLAGLIPSLNE